MNKSRYKTMRRCWSNMIRRCHDINNPTYKYYGAKGITVCEEWRESFPQFYEDMYDDWAPGLEIDRIDPYGGYNPKNCRWITKHENVTRQRRRGAPRKRQSEKRVYQTAVHLTKEESEFLRNEAKRQAVSVSSLLRFAVEEMLFRGTVDKIN